MHRGLRRSRGTIPAYVLYGDASPSNQANAI